MMKMAHHLFIKYDKVERLLLSADPAVWVAIFDTITITKADQLAQSLVSISS